uniref:Uncharacterized protein n=1 Tax=Magallana gigas TaxID=29159 RepID=A0A8W8P373_MAGGI|nr:uncharacterized protein LOC117687173 [Crassostrea gigas]
MRILQLCLSICVVILFCDRGKTSNTTTLRSRKPTIGPVFVTVSQSPNKPSVMQVLIRFAGPPETLVYYNLKDLKKVQVSGGDFVSVVDLKKGNDDWVLFLGSETTSESVLFNLRPVIGFYKIHLNCNVDVTSSDVGEITTYTIVVSECPREETEGEWEEYEWGLLHYLYKGAKPIPSVDYLTIEENKQSTLGNVTTVSFNRSSLINDNIDMRLYFRFYTYSWDTLVPEIEWNYILD